MNGYVALEIAIGHKLGLFSALKKFNSPVTSHELADSCKLKERYYISLAQPTDTTNGQLLWDSRA
jgi:hypothetical protein